MTKRLNNSDWRTWGVEELIPERVLDRMLATRYLYVPYVYKQAQTHVREVLGSYGSKHDKAFHATGYKELQEESLEEALARLDPDPAIENTFDMGLILEYAFVITMIEKYLQEHAFESRRLSEKV
jgi:hypothetical protein